MQFTGKNHAGKTGKKFLMDILKFVSIQWQHCNQYKNKPKLILSLFFVENKLEQKMHTTDKRR